MGDRVYCYQNSEVLINKLNIRDRDRLYEAERKLTMLRLNDLIDKPIRGKFDLKHLQSIHQYIFQDIYSWAGKVRTVDIAKSNMFCKVQYIEVQAKEIFDSLKKEMGERRENLSVSWHYSRGMLFILQGLAEKKC